MAILSDRAIRNLSMPPYRHENYLEKTPHYDEEGTMVAATVRVDPQSIIDNEGKPMITPFEYDLVREHESESEVYDGHQLQKEKVKVISYGTTSYGYDVRLQDQVKIFTNAHSKIVDPMEPDDKSFIDAEVHVNEKGLKYFILPPNSYALGVTMEYFRIPKNVMVICVGKSTYARSCVLVNTTPIEAGFEGEVVIEIANGSTLPVKVYLETGIAQFMFLRGDQECETSYADGDRKYQGQRGITLSKV